MWDVGCGRRSVRGIETQKYGMDIQMPDRPDIAIICLSIFSEYVIDILIHLRYREGHFLIRYVTTRALDLNHGALT
jgi:hypothetical protein